MVAARRPGESERLLYLSALALRLINGGWLLMWAVIVGNPFTRLFTETRAFAGTEQYWALAAALILAGKLLGLWRSRRLREASQLLGIGFWCMVLAGHLVSGAWYALMFYPGFALSAFAGWALESASVRLPPRV